MKLNRRQLRNLILKEYKLVEKMLVQPDGTVINTSPISGVKDSISDNIDTKINVTNDKPARGMPRSFDYNIEQKINDAISIPEKLRRPGGTLRGTFYISQDPTNIASFSGSRKRPVYLSFVKSPAIKIGILDLAFNDLPDEMPVGLPFMGSVILDETGAPDFSTFSVTYV